jgi:hypothetical protein
MSKDKAVAAPVRAIDPDMILDWTFEGVTYKYTQPAGVFPGTTQKEHGDALIDACLVSVEGLVDSDELRAKGHKWSRILPQNHANWLYIQLLTASKLTEAEAEG